MQAAHETRGPLDFLPGFREETFGGHRAHPPTTVFSGTLRPFGQHTPDVILKLARSTADFYLDPQGSIRLADPRQLAGVTSVCSPRDVAGLRGREFKVELWVPADGSPPSFYAVSPKIDLLSHPDHPHMYLRRELTRAGVFTNELCSYPKHYGLWNPQTRNVYTLLCVGALWLAKHAFWEQSRWWLGPQASHDKHVIAAVRAARGIDVSGGPLLDRRVA